MLRGIGDSQTTKVSLLHQSGRTAESLEPMKEAVAAFDQLIPSEPQNFELREAFGRALMNLGTLSTNLNHVDDAGRLFERALTNYDGLIRDRPNHSQYAFGLGLAHQSLAWWLTRAGRERESLEEYRLSIEIFDRLARDHPDVAEYASRQALALINRGNMLRSLNRLDEALETMQRAQGVVAAVIRKYPDVPLYQGMSADLAINIAAVFNAMGRSAEAKTAYTQALLEHDRLQNKTEVDRFNVACLHGRLAILIAAEPDGSTPARREEVARHLDQAMDALFAAVKAGYRRRSAFAGDPDLELLRSRPDFGRLMMDLGFPDNPFAN